MKKTVVLVIVIACFSFIKKIERYQYPELLYFPKIPVHENNKLTNEGIELGRYLFYDPILSHDSSTSCASCHQQKHAFSDSPNQFSKGSKQLQTKRNTPPLFNLAWYEKMFWDGRSKTIEEQGFHPIRGEEEMGFNWIDAQERIQNSSFYLPLFQKVFGTQKIDSTLIVYAIAQFERTLISHNSKMDSASRGETYLSRQELRGYELINNQVKGNCLHCHNIDENLLGTTGKFSNNGLDMATSARDFSDPGLGATTHSDSDFGKFKIPSLRNLLFTAPYMHDGRFETLEEVLHFYNEQVQDSYTVDPRMEQVHEGKKRLNNQEIEDIIAYLITLTDSSFISNPNFSTPF